MKSLKQKPQNDFYALDAFYNDYLSSQEENCFSKVSTLDTSQDYSSNCEPTLYINEVRTRLEEFTEGDTEFICEFANYIFQNMKMLEDELPRNYCARDASQFTKMLHMVKPTIEMLGDNNFLIDLKTMCSEWQRGIFNRQKVKDAMKKAVYYQTKLVEVSNFPYHQMRYAS